MGPVFQCKSIYIRTYRVWRAICLKHRPAGQQLRCATYWHQMTRLLNGSVHCSPQAKSEVIIMLVSRDMRRVSSDPCRRRAIANSAQVKTCNKRLKLSRKLLRISKLSKQETRSCILCQTRMIMVAKLEIWRVCVSEYLCILTFDLLLYVSYLIFQCVFQLWN